MISNVGKKPAYILLVSIMLLGFLNSRMILAQYPLSVILDIAWSPDSQMLATLDSSGSLIVRELNQAEPVFQFTRPSELLKAAIAWNSKGDQLVAGIGNRAYIWQVPSWQLLHEFEVGLPSGFFTWGSSEDIPEGVQTITWSSDDRYVVVGTYSYQTSVWDTQEAHLIFQEGDLSGGGPGRVWLNDGWLGDGANKLNIYTNEAILTPASASFCRFGGSGEGGTTEPNPNKNLIAWGFSNGPFLQIRDLNTLCGVIAFQLTTNELTPSIEWIPDISWSGNGDFIAAISSIGEIYVTNIITGEVELVIDTDVELYAIDWNPTSNEVIYSGISETGQPILEIVDVTGIAGVPPIPSISLVESDATTTVTESGTSDTYTLALGTQPTGDVVVSVAWTDQVTVSPATLTFTPENWDVPQTVTVTAVDDSDVEGDHTAVITHSAVSTDAGYNGVSVAGVTVNIGDFAP